MIMLTSLLGSRLNQANHRFLQFANHRGDGGNCWLYNRSSSSAEGNLFKFFIKPRLKISYDANSNTEEEDKRWGTVRDRKVRNAWKERVENPEVINLYNAVLRNLPEEFYPKRRFINVHIDNIGTQWQGIVK